MHNQSDRIRKRLKNNLLSWTRAVMRLKSFHLPVSWQVSSCSLLLLLLFWHRLGFCWGVWNNFHRNWLLQIQNAAREHLFAQEITEFSSFFFQLIQFNCLHFYTAKQIRVVTSQENVCGLQTNYHVVVHNRHMPPNSPPTPPKQTQLLCSDYSTSILKPMPWVYMAEYCTVSL